MAMVVDEIPLMSQGVNYSVIDYPFLFSTEDTTINLYKNGSQNMSEAESFSNLDPCKQILPHDYYDTWRDMKFWCLAFIIPTGLVFNFISLGVFMTSWMRHVVPGRYFIGLALADNLVLTGELLLWLNTKDIHRGSKLGVEFHHSVDFFCKFINFLRYGARMWSSWLTVAITIERFLSVSFPFKITRLSSPRKAVIVVSTLGVICFSLACFAFFTLEAKPYQGSPLCQYTNRLHYSVWLVAVIAIIGEMVIPSFVVTIFTLLIIWKLALAKRERLRMRSNNGKCGRRRHRNSELQPTIALLAIAIVFVSIRMPYVIMFFINEYKKLLWKCLDKWLSYRIYVIYSVSMVLAVLNYAVNFCLYCITGTTFRTEVRRCMFFRVPNYIIPKTHRSNVLVYRCPESGFSRGNSTPAVVSCPEQVQPITWNLEKGSSEGPDMVETFQMEERVTDEYVRCQKQQTTPHSPPIWSERSRKPSKTFVVRDGSRYLELDKSKLRLSHSEEHLGARAALDQNLANFGAIDDKFQRQGDKADRQRVVMGKIGNIAFRNKADLCHIEGCYDPKTQTVIFIAAGGNSPSGCRKPVYRGKRWSCFQTSSGSNNIAGGRNTPDFC